MTRRRQPSLTVTGIVGIDDAGLRDSLLSHPLSLANSSRSLTDAGACSTIGQSFGE